MKVHCVMQRAVRDAELPKAAQVRGWIGAALAAAWSRRRGAALMLADDAALQLTVRWVKPAEMQKLNHTFRGKDAPTNVLSFDYADYPLGDLLICPAVVHDECQRYQQPFTARTAHMVVHGLLHLLGLDHQNPVDEKMMEELEVNIIMDLGFPHPFQQGRVG